MGAFCENAATATATIASWEEEPYEDEDGVKLTQARVALVLSGDLEGKGAMVFLMCYRTDGRVSFIGQQRITGSLGGRAGSFSLHGHGLFTDGEARWDWSIVPGSGTGELSGIGGGGKSVASAERTVSLEFEYGFD